MKNFKFLFYTYLAALAVIPIANIFGLDLQILLRLPLISIRFIDIAIFIIAVSFVKLLLTPDYQINGRATKFVIFAIGSFLTFQIFNFFRTFGAIDLISQLGILSAYFSLLIVINIILSLDKDQILNLFKNLIILSVYILILFNFSLVFAFLTGSADILDDVAGKRVLFSAAGMKETIGMANITALGFFAGLFRKNLKLKKQIHSYAFFTLVILVLLTSLFSFHRGTIATIIFILGIYFLYSSKKIGKLIRNVAVIILFLAGSIYFFYDSYVKSGVDPIENLFDTAIYAADTDNPNWDKGRTFSRLLGLEVWQSNVWFGIGYDNMGNHTKTVDVAYPHQFIITSLMHNGVIGTIFFITFYFLFYFKTFRLYKILRQPNFPEVERVLIIGLIIVAVVWLIPLFTQEVQFERYSSSIQYFFFGAIVKLVDIYEGK